MKERAYTQINYEVWRSAKPRRGMVTHSGKLMLAGAWEDEEFHRRVRERIAKRHSGWLLAGYAKAKS